MELTLQRLTPLDKSDNGTFGVFISDKPLFVTLELPWKNNQHGISCIPAGTYTCVKTFSKHFNKNVYILQNVPERDSIEIHIANTVEDIRGCIAIGMEFSLSEYAIVNSKLAFDSFMSMMPDTFTLTVKDIQ